MKATTVLILMFVSCMLLGQTQSVSTTLAEADHFLNHGHLAKANSLLQSLNLSSQQESALDQNRILALQARIWQKQNQLEKADSLYQIIITNFESLGANVDWAMALKNKALGLLDIGELDPALEQLLEAKELLDDQNDHEALVKVYNAIASVYQEIVDDENQMAALNEALKLLENTDNNHLKGVTYFNLANFYSLFEGEEVRVEENLENARRYFEKEENSYLLIKVKEIQISLLAEKEGQENKIRTLHEELVEESKSYEDSFLLAEVHYNYAAFESNLLLDQDDSYSDISRNNLNQLNRTSELAELSYAFLPQEMRNTALGAEIMLLIGDLKYLSKDYEKSYQFMDAAMAVKEELGSNENVNRSSFQSKLDLLRAEELNKQQARNLNLLRGIGGLLGGVVILLISLLVYVRRVNFVQQKSLRLRLFGDFLQRLDKEKEQFQRKERKRISKNLHDKVSSQLAAIKWLFESKVDDLEQNKLESGDLDSIMKMLEDAYAETRILSREIETEGPTTRLLALRNRLAAIENNDRLKVEFSIEGFAGKPILYTIEDHISSIVMEMMANTFKYANAKVLKIDIKRTDQEIKLHMSDDGIGFDMEKHRNGHGVRNIHERVNDMNGQLSFDAQLGKGVQLDISIPLNRA